MGLCSVPFSDSYLKFIVRWEWSKKLMNVNRGWKKFESQSLSGIWVCVLVWFNFLTKIEQLLRKTSIRTSSGKKKQKKRKKKLCQSVWISKNFHVSSENHFFLRNETGSKGDESISKESRRLSFVWEN